MQVCVLVAIPKIEPIYSSIADYIPVGLSCLSSRLLFGYESITSALHFSSVLYHILTSAIPIPCQRGKSCQRGKYGVNKG